MKISHTIKVNFTFCLIICATCVKICEKDAMSEIIAIYYTNYRTLSYHTYFFKYILFFKAIIHIFLNIYYFQSYNTFFFCYTTHRHPLPHQNQYQ